MISDVDIVFLIFFTTIKLDPVLPRGAITRGSQN